MGLLDKIFGSDDEMKKRFKVGDWVNSYSKGVYRIECIIDEYYDESSPILGDNKIGDKKEHDADCHPTEQVECIVDSILWEEPQCPPKTGPSLISDVLYPWLRSHPEKKRKLSKAMAI